MTVSSIVPVNNYTGNSSVKRFDFDFLIEDEDELIVQYVNELDETKILTLGVDYSINEIGNPNGSYITFPLDSSSYNILSNNEKISLMLKLDIKQESEFKNSSYFNLNILEWTFDYIIRILQILNRKVERSVKISEGASYTPDELINQIKTSEINAVQAATTANEAKEFIEENEALHCVAEDIQGPNNIANVLNNIINIDKVANSILNVNTVGNNINKVISVAENEDNINIVNENQSNINTCANNINDIKNAYQSAIDSAQLAKKWASSDNIIENGLHSAKYYAQQAQSTSGVTYSDLRASSAFENTGILSSNEEGFLNIQNNAHSTFNPSKITVVGNPTITDNGIMSGFAENNANYVIVLEDFLIDGNNLKLTIGGTFNGLPQTTANAPLIQILEKTTTNVRILVYQLAGNGGIQAVVYNGTNAVYSKTILPNDLNGKFIIKLTWNIGNNVIVNLIQNNALIGTISVNFEYEFSSSCRVRLGFGLDGVFPGTLDLKQTEIFLDSYPIYSCNKTGIDVINDVEIPYTESKTGSKIVDAYYRDRVQNVYEQYGTAMYYTIDEENQNFTLPMGEIYGMIENKTDKETFKDEISSINSNKMNKDGSNAEFPYIIETYQNESNWYRVWSDGWCEQGGRFVAGSANTWKPITLFKKMLNSKYSVLLTNCGEQSTAYKLKAGNEVKNTTTTVFVLCENANTGIIWQVKGYTNSAYDDEIVEEQEPTL